MENQSIDIFNQLFDLFTDAITEKMLKKIDIAIIYHELTENIIKILSLPNDSRLNYILHTELLRYIPIFNCTKIQSHILTNNLNF